MPFAKGQSGNPKTQFAKGKSGNPQGRPKGVQSWSTIVRQLLDEEDLPEKLLSKKPGWWEQVKHRKAGELIVVAMITQALTGNDKAATWLRKTGYGDRLDIVSDDKPIAGLAILDMTPGGPKVVVQDANKPKPAKKAPAKKKATTKKPKKK